MAGTDIHRSVETVFRIEQARLIAGLTRMLRDVGLAEELAQDALVTALSEWPKAGVPDSPGAWLMAAAKRRAIDRLRRAKMQNRNHAEIGRSSHSPLPSTSRKRLVQCTASSIVLTWNRA